MLVLNLLIYKGTQQSFTCSKSEIRGGSRIAATSKVELFVIIVNSFQPLTIITRSSTLVVAAVLDPPLGMEAREECVKSIQK